MKRLLLRAGTLVVLAVPCAAAQRLEATVRDTVHHPTGERVGAGLSFGIVTGFVAFSTGLCLHPSRCNSYDGAVAGYLTGIVLGNALVHAERCRFPKRLGVSLAGALAGAALSFGVASASHMAKDAAAVFATVVAGGAPVVGASIALRMCD